MPAKEAGDASTQADDSIFLLLVRGDRAPPAEEYQDLDCTFEPEDATLPGDQTPRPKTRTLVPDCEVEDTGADGKP